MCLDDELRKPTIGLDLPFCTSHALLFAQDISWAHGHSYPAIALSDSVIGQQLKCYHHRIASAEATSDVRK